MSAALICRTGDGRPRTLEPGVAVYLWAGKGLRHAFAKSLAILQRTRPDIVILHGPPSGLLSTHFAPLVAQVRAALPGVRIWVGIGGDGWAAQWRAGKCSDAQVVTPLVAAFAAAQAVGAEAVVPDLEAAWKSSKKGASVPDVKTRAQLEALARRVMVEGGAAAPDAVIALCSYDIPDLHKAFPLAACVVGTPVSVFAYMAYAADSTPDAGELLRRVAWAQREQEKAEGMGLLPDDVTGTDVPGDVDRVPIVQLHQLAMHDLVTVLAEFPLVMAWAAPLIVDGGRADPSGVLALEAALYLRREVGGGPGAIARFQARAGLTADGIVGPKTLAKLEAQRKMIA